MTGGELAAGGISGVLLSVAIVLLKARVADWSKTTTLLVALALAAVVAVIDTAATGQLNSVGDWLKNLTVVVGVSQTFYGYILKGLQLESRIK